MQTKKYAKGTVIFRAGDPLEHVSLITEGDVSVSSGGYAFTLGKTDALGLADVKRGKYTHTCTALTDATLCHYPCSGSDFLDTLSYKNPDVSYLMVTFMCRHIVSMLSYITQLKSEADAMPALVRDLYDEYSRLCNFFSSAQKPMPELPQATAPAGGDLVPQQLVDYYAEISRLRTDVRKELFHGNPGIKSVFLHICADDASSVYNTCKAHFDYLKSLSSLLLGDAGTDLFSLISQLHISSADKEGADFAIDALMSSLTEKLSKLSDLSVFKPDYYNKRIEEYNDTLENRRESSADVWDMYQADVPAPATEIQAAEDVPAEPPAPVILDDDADLDVPVVEGTAQEDDSALIPQLANSLNDILKYAEADKELAEAFARDIRAFTAVSDRNSSEDDVSDLRRNITKSFFKIYKLVFVKTLQDSSPPTVINMFLNFGYVDGDLAGHGNANYLYEIADLFKGDPEKHVYTGREWLESIYRGKNEPSLSEFDMDFKEYVRDLKNSRQIDANEEKRLLGDLDAKLNYEMDNAFPVVNRVTFGSPSRYCPVFASHNVFRALKDTLVAPQKVINIIEEIRSIDFSAFYRETAYSNSALGINREQINVEVIPNFILMPNVGLRGSMWQDIEGRVRTTPGRIFLPVFLENDLKPLVMRLAGEFRWEICRRIQGTRWNDMTDPSLTSYFCDYLQFYMNNRNISMQTMTEIRNELSAARNNYKAVFVSNYVTWLQNESRGMARLNNIALGILMTFCPFSAGIREHLKTNMRFNEALNRYNVRRQKRVTHMANLLKKLNQTGKGVPQELKDEYEFWNK